MKHLLKFILILMLPVLGGCSANNSSPSPQEIVGTYMGRYGGGVETFEILTNGTFTQTFQIGTNIVYTMNGKWQFEKEATLDGKWQVKTNLNGVFIEDKISDEKRVVQVNRITFKPFMIPNGIYKRGDMKVDAAPGGWSRNPIRIEFGAWPYFVDKVAGQGAIVDTSGFKLP